VTEVGWGPTSQRRPRPTIHTPSTTRASEKFSKKGMKMCHYARIYHVQVYQKPGRSTLGHPQILEFFRRPTGKSGEYADWHKTSWIVMAYF
jgi:hypothetical protein